MLARVVTRASHASLLFEAKLHGPISRRSGGRDFSPRGHVVVRTLLLAIDFIVAAQVPNVRPSSTPYTRRSSLSAPPSLRACVRCMPLVSTPYSSVDAASSVALASTTGATAASSAGAWGWGLRSKLRRVAESERQWETAGVYCWVYSERLHTSRRHEEQ